ncbi:MAG: thiamine phosphate synthase [Pseudomonadota bacterium]
MRVAINQTLLPDLWLLSDRRNDAALETALAQLPRGSGFLYRHYHLPDPERYHRFWTLRRIAKARGHRVILADSAMTALEWGADGVYGAPLALWPRPTRLMQLASAHNPKEIAQAARKGVDAILLSPVFATRSHPGGACLGPVRFRHLARLAPMPVIALGGMTPDTAARLAWPRWAAIDGLSPGPLAADRLTGAG